MTRLSTERAIDALDTVRAYYASLTVGYPKGKDCKGIGDVMCSEIANSCLIAIKALRQEQDEVILTKEEYGELVSSEFDNGYTKGYREALEQESVLDKIKAEINGMYRVILKGTPEDDWAVKWNDCLDEVLQIIDKYKESEG